MKNAPFEGSGHGLDDLNVVAADQRGGGVVEGGDSEQPGDYHLHAFPALRRLAAPMTMTTTEIAHRPRRREN